MSLSCGDREGTGQWRGSESIRWKLKGDSVPLLRHQPEVPHEMFQKLPHSLVWGPYSAGPLRLKNPLINTTRGDGKYEHHAHCGSTFSVDRRNYCWRFNSADRSPVDHCERGA